MTMIITGEYMTQQHTLATDTIMLPDRDLGIWRWLVSRGVANSIAGLSRMVSHELNVYELDVNHTIDDELRLTGYCDKKAVGIYLSITGDATGHLLLVHNSELVFNMVDHQMQLSPGYGKEACELKLSFLEEMGNTAGAFFLNVLSDVTNLHLLPSPPKVMINTTRTIMDQVFIPIFDEEDAMFIVKAKFGDNRQQIQDTFFFIPTMDLMRMILENTRIT